MCKSEILLINGVKFERAPGWYQLYVDHALFYQLFFCQFFLFETRSCSCTESRSDLCGYHVYECCLRFNIALARRQQSVRRGAYRVIYKSNKSSICRGQMSSRIANLLVWRKRSATCFLLIVALDKFTRLKLFCKEEAWKLNIKSLTRAVIIIIMMFNYLEIHY